MTGINKEVLRAPHLHPLLFAASTSEMLGPTPKAPFRQYETPFLKPLLLVSIYREPPATVDAFLLQAFEGRVDPRSNAQVLLVFDEPAFF